MQLKRKCAREGAFLRFLYFSLRGSLFDDIMSVSETEYLPDRKDGKMGRFLNPDNSAFQIALNSEIYIDKTELLDLTNRSINTNSAFICNSRPRRFGKSITANMLAAYYSKGCDRNAFRDTDRDDVLTYLIHLGYLGYDQKKRMAFIPNEEIRQELLF